MNDRIYDIIGKQLSGNELTSEDSTILEAWLQEEGSQKELNEYGEIWKISSKGEGKITPDISLEWERFTQLKDKESKSVKPVKKLTSFHWLVAASIALLISIGIYFTNTNGTIEIYAHLQTEKVILPDNSEVTLNKNSSLHYAKDFGTAKREVILEGEAFFQIEKSKVPFIVQTQSGVNTTVLGTQFYLRAVKKETQIELNVIEGLVAFGKGDASLHTQVALGESAVFIIKTEKVEKQEIKSNKIAWRSKKLKFDNAPLTEVERVLEEYFSIQIIFPKDISDLYYSGTFTNPKVSDVAEVLALSFSWHYEFKNQQLNFTK